MAEKNTNKTLEKAFEELETVIAELESEDITLEESFQKYKKGMDLLKLCNDKIDKVEKKMLVLGGNGELNEF